MTSRWFGLVAVCVGMALLPSCAACAPIPSAPDDFDGATRWFLTNSAIANDSQLLESAAKIETAIDDAFLKMPKGTLARLKAEELTSLPAAPKSEVGKARGFYFARLLACPLARVEEFMAKPELWVAINSEIFKKSDRTYVGSATDFFDGKSDVLEWDALSHGHVLDAQYIADQRVLLRRAKARSARSKPESILVRQLVMRAPAKFEGTDVTFNHDFQVELFWEREPGKTLHIVGAWRELRILTLGVSFEDNFVINGDIDNMQAVDTKLEKACATP